MKCCHWLHRLLTCGVLLAAPSLAAFAADDDSAAVERREKLFKQLDRNDDGEISGDELGPDQQRMFKRLVGTSDKNSDGKLSREEFLAGTKEAPPPREPGRGVPGGGGTSPEQAEMIFKQLDANGDGKLVIEEVPEERRPRFAILIERADADGDKSLTLVEFTKGLAMARAGQDGGGSQGQPSPSASQGAQQGMGPGEAIFRGLDTNSDGKLSKDEIDAAPKSLEKLDRNGDGEVTRQELGGPRQYAQGGRPDGGQPDGRQAGKGQAGNGQAGNGQAGAGQPGGDGKAFFHHLDRNGDGKLTKDEMPERMQENFDKRDANGDGSLDESEFIRTMQRRPGGPGGQPNAGVRDFKSMDTNGDGKLSKDEAPERMREHFDKIDANGDGYLEPEELQKAMQAMRGRGQGRGPQETPDPKQMLKRLDTNEDGKLSKEELPERMRENFDKVDANGDGFVDADELQRAISAMNRNRQDQPGGRRRPADGDNNK